MAARLNLVAPVWTGAINKALRPMPPTNLNRTNKKYRIKICMFLQAPSEIHLGRGLLTFFFASCCFLCCYWSLRIFSIIADWRCPLTWWCLYDCHILLPPFFYFFHFQYAGFLHKNNGLFLPAILSDMEFCVRCFSFLYLLYSICSNIRHIMFICICQQLIQC